MRARPLFSSSWYRVSALRPRLPGHARIERQTYRGQSWHVLEDRVSERFYRFSPAAYLLIGLMDGRRTVAEIWDIACERLGDDAPTQDETIELLSQLHAADVLQCDVTPDAAELFERSRQQRRRRVASQLLSPFTWRLPLVDPEAFLQRVVPVGRPLLGWLAALLWLAMVVPAAGLLALHWRDFTGDVADRVFSISSLVTLWLLFPVIKTLHEMGHAVVVKAYGGEVHDMGIMVMVLTPVPYVDASAAWAFPDKRRRMAVGAAGMLVEIFIAALAVLVWANAEAGLVRSVAFATIVSVLVSTLLFNANPLLRFDGYYILSDWLEIPNLARRARLYLAYLCERYAFGRPDAPPPAASAGERGWFVVYGIASFVYRVTVVVAIAMFLGRRSVYLAALFVALAGVSWLLLPLGRGVAYLAASPRLRKVRVRAITVTTVAVAVVIHVVGVLPVPDRSRAEGVVWIPDESFVRARTEGFIRSMPAAPGQRVSRGEPLVVLGDPSLLARTAQLEARRVELVARYDEQQPRDRVKAQIVQDELRVVDEGLAEARGRLRDLTILADASGTFVAPAPSAVVRSECPCSPQLSGRFLKNGDLIGHVVELGTVIVRAVVRQEEIERIADQTTTVQVRLAERLDQPLPARVRRIVPAAAERLPDAALGTEGGGRVVVDPRDTAAVTALLRFFEVDLEVSTGRPLLNAGGRAYVRFDHGRRPLAQQWYRELRQLFLAQFNV